tara:strand:- start:353 stop:763 length:411 start_codon:yes stop_codon:yes gene_type:complete
MRAVGVDLGEKRIGVAISDRDATLATPYEVLIRSGSGEHDHAKIRAIVEEVEAELVVIGLPLSLDGTEGPAAKSARIEAGLIAEATQVPVQLQDERLTTVEAERILKEQGLDTQQRRQIIDKVAAAILLQAWIDGQ